jgi:hypothetical protein
VPTPNYEIKFGVASDGRGRIDDDRKVLVVLVKESTIGPHMAHDNKYYIRAGTHTEPSRHFLVEAIWAKRHLLKPRIAHVVRPRAYPKTEPKSAASVEHDRSITCSSHGGEYELRLV